VTTAHRRAHLSGPIRYTAESYNRG